ncbi:DUF3426 domain-containing protein [Undibacterium sp. RuRC25W]|uniref:DUF3426 domain-containing protein n=1 Tax=Undibacterium sp. RuRC25W TaxID=3413047 RepID=UPI003BF1BA6E
MALATRCPHCMTTFRVANDQLKLHAGLVRCGSCQQTFNGVEHLIPLDGVKSTTPNSSDNQVPPPSATTEPQIQHIEQTPEVPEAPADTLPEDTFSILPNEDLNDLESWQTADAGSVVDEQSTAETVAPTAQPETSTEILPDSAASLDFLLGDDDIDLFADPATPDANLATKVELETKAVTLEPTDDSWSLTDTPESSLTINEDAGHQEQDSQSHLEPTPDELREPYIGETESALANHAALAEDSVSDVVGHAAHIDDAGNPVDGEMAAEEKPDFVLKAEREQKRGRIVRIAMLVSCLLLLPLLLLQAIYIFRVQIAANFPESKAALIKACDVMHCQVNLPAQIERISVESNELESPPPEGKAFSLSIQLQNNSATLQSWPHIELILNDEKDKAVLQKAFTPSDYLTDQTVLSKGFAPKSQQNIKVYFELPKLRASGYHVSIFYP